MSGIRCFVGIPLSTDVRAALLRGCASIRSNDRSWRDEKWVAEENLHVTVKFLGNLAEEELPALVRALGTAIERLDSFEMPLAPLRAVPGTKRCRMLWGSFLDPDGACAALAAAVEGAALEFGVAPEDRPFTPHVTLCRARKPKSLSAEALELAQEALSGAPEQMSVPSATLFSSRLTPRGPTYCEVGAWQLRGE